MSTRHLPGGVEVHPEAVVDSTVRIYPSVRGTRIVIGARTQIDAFSVLRAVGGLADIVIGQDCRINPHCVLYSGNGIHIGNHVLLAPSVAIVPANHAFERRDIPIANQGFLASRGGVVIEDDVWIGTHSAVLDGSYIERGAIIASGSVVRGRVPAYQIWGGTPAQFMNDRP